MATDGTIEQYTPANIKTKLPTHRFIKELADEDIEMTDEFDEYSQD